MNVLSLLSSINVKDESLDCTEVADSFMEANPAGKMITISFAGESASECICNMDCALHRVRVPVANGLRCVEYQYHTVYIFGENVYDPRYSRTPVPICKYMKELRALNDFEIKIYMEV